MSIIIIFNYNRMKYYLILLAILILFIFYYSNNESFINRNELNNLFLNNKKQIYKVNILKNKQDINQCFKKCNYNDCLKLKYLKRNYENCLECQKNKNKCYNNLLTNGSCDSCGSSLKKFNCNDLNYYSCPPLNDVYNNKGTSPYYLEVIDKKKVTSPYNQSCLFCWNLKSYL